MTTFYDTMVQTMSSWQFIFSIAGLFLFSVHRSLKKLNSDIASFYNEYSQNITLAILYGIMSLEEGKRYMYNLKNFKQVKNRFWLKEVDYFIDIGMATESLSKLTKLSNVLEKQYGLK